MTTLPAQLQGAKFTWRDYNEDMGADPTRESATCGHPVVGQPDHTEAATATDMYATRHDPFVYFHSIIDDAALCDSHVVNLKHLPDGPLACRRHAQLHLHHPRPVRRRPRRHLRQRPDRRAARPPTRS